MDSFPHFFSVHSHFSTSFTQKNSLLKSFTQVFFQLLISSLNMIVSSLIILNFLWITHSTTTFFRKCRHPVENFFHPCVLFFHIEQLLVEKVLKKMLKSTMLILLSYPHFLDNQNLNI